MPVKWKEMLIAAVMGLLCPALIFSMRHDAKTEPESLPKMTTVQAEAPTAGEETEPSLEAMTVRVLMEDGTIQQQDLESYITSVVLREMPAEFEPEALKAQAVVARTYTLRRRENTGKHPGADICTDSACCQGYWDVAAYLREGGSQESVNKVSDAVNATQAQVLTYQGKLIEATYFSCSGGMTEDAAAVWGSDLPYLQAVKSPGEEQAGHYTDTVSFSAEDFQAKLQVKLSGSPETWIGKITYTDGGGVATMRIGEQTFTGVELRQKLGLRSTAMVITAVGNRVTVTTKGFGHRVGMSQYGADAMAVTGSTYEEILSHYYQKTLLQRWSDVD